MVLYHTQMRCHVTHPESRDQCKYLQQVGDKTDTYPWVKVQNFHNPELSKFQS